MSVTLDKGLTVITGPNGSGKSNVMDGLKFALGELSPKELRGTNLTDIIHKSSPTSQARSAWVSVQFDNTDRRIPVEASSISISREFRQGGEGIYRLNGRRISRKHLTDIMSSADIQVTGYNLVAQHAITRLAEVTSDERRRIIEDMLGIAVYDMKREGSKQQLQISDMNLRVASARIGEVTERVESLERERNNYIRFSILQSECGRLEAKLISETIRKLRESLGLLQTEAGKKHARIEQLKSSRDELARTRSGIEEKRRIFEQDTVAEESAELFRIERKIGDMKAKITALSTETHGNENRLETLTRRRGALSASKADLTSQLETYHKQYQELLSVLDETRGLMDQKEQAHSVLENSIRQKREEFGENVRKIDCLDNQLQSLSQNLSRLDSDTRIIETRIELLLQKRDSSQVRSNEYRGLMEDIERRLQDLSHLKTEQSDELSTMHSRLVEINVLIEDRSQGIQKAINVLEKAESSLVEFETQRNLLHSLAPEEEALRELEEMADSGGLKGVIGRLERLVTINPRCAKAVEAASGGWLKALVVNDIETAITCAEILKKMELARIKVIPVQILSYRKSLDKIPELPGVLGPITDFMKYSAEIAPAVDFVFGDTVVADNQRTAFLCSLEGVRTVVLSGDLYELGGGLECGYYREPLDITAITPKDSTVESLTETTESLRDLLERGQLEISRLRVTVGELKENRISSERAKERITSETLELEQKFETIRNNLETTLDIVGKTSAEIDSLAGQLVSLKSERQDAEASLAKAREERERENKSIAQSELSRIENELLQMTRELNESKRRHIELEGKLALVKSSSTTAEESLKEKAIELDGVVEEIERLEINLAKSRNEVQAFNGELEASEEKRETLSESLSQVQQKRDDFEKELRSIDERLSPAFTEYDSLSAELSQLTAGAKEKELEIDFQAKKLKELGQEEFSTDPEEIKRAEQTLVILGRELRDIGAVNQLAPQQYEDVVGNYRQLSVRINELEKEKLAIINFMNELDQKKCDAFMAGFEKVNKSFQEVFSKLTGSGRGRFILENPETPFEGGLDILLQFPGKAELPLGSASGGEKSVSTVCFLLALQSIHPLPFYVFDEIDAHLDVLNAQKLADLLKSRSKDSQFMVISLKDTTIARANRVYGVFVQEGVSQIVSLPTKAAS